MRKPGRGIKKDERSPDQYGSNQQGPLALPLSRLIGKFLAMGLSWLPASQLEDFVLYLIRRKVKSLAPDEALRLLFRLDGQLYSLQGLKAVEYGGGVHTKHRHTRYHDFFVDRIRSGEKVLDVGCGIGAVAYDLAEKRGAQVVGIDLNANSIAEARQRHSHPKVEYMVGNVLQDLPEGSFDVVILSNVLEHLRERPIFLRRVRKLTQTSRFLIRVPLFERDWRIPLKRELGVEYRLDPTHEIEYTQESFAAEQSAAGLRITHQEIRWGEIWVEATPDDS
jgi:SAM-dependent methyltransferase